MIQIDTKHPHPGILKQNQKSSMNCKRCGESFEVNYHAAGKPQAYCSKRCRKAEEKRRGKMRRRGYSDAQYTEETGLHPSKGRCPNCDAVFERYSDFENRQGWRKYCSANCQQENKRVNQRLNAPLREKVCPACGVTHREKGVKYCSDACREEGKKRNQERQNKKKFRGHPITKEEYDALYEEQQGRCWICKEESRLVIDHCHAEGHVRGLLCSHCSSGLGFFRDQVALLNRASEYLSEKIAKNS